MQESTGRESSTEKASEEEAAGADSEATSKETLSDIDENEKNAGSSSSDVNPGPSPDGALDESDQSKDLGPM